MLLQLALVAMSVIAAYHLTRSHTIIPKSVLPLPPVYVSGEDMWAMVRIFCVVFGLQGLALLFRTGAGAFTSGERFAREYLWYLVAYTTASLYAFLATTINYDAQLVAGIGLLSTASYLLAFVVLAAVGQGRRVLPDAGRFLGGIARGLFRPSGVLVILYFLSPLALGVAFSKSRDVANVVTQVRIWFNPVEETAWGFRSFLAGLVFEQPLLVVERAGDPGAIYVLERVGRVLRVPLADPEALELVLDIRDQLGVVEVENGALGMAFDPRFDDIEAPRPFLYLYYTDTRSDGGQVNRISRFDLSQPTAYERAISEEPLMILEREGSGFHNGGSLVFGPGGYLYIALGEGVRTPEGFTSAQVLRAGILRIDVSGGKANGLPIEPFEFGELAGYRVPADNPFVHDPRVRDEYWALGLRNPYRVSFDPETNTLWAGDVGSTVWEEVNRIEAGNHYGFPVVEGREVTGKQGWESLGLAHTEPVFTYVHTAYDRAVIGGIVYRGNLHPTLEGQYLFADNYSSKLFSLPADVRRVEQVNLLARANQYAQRGVSSVTQLSSGEVLVTTLGAASTPSGEILELVPAELADNTLPESLREREGRVRIGAKEAASLYQANCARCHGSAGDGDSPDARALGVPLPDFTDPNYLSSRGRDKVRAIISEGGAAHGMSALMPPWATALSDAELNALVDFIGTLHGNDNK
ncbi:PQQ-dependent sugar dehydrogenase [Pseudohaliea sp.]|uniref:PQQ-dependent sugar dehydrogenase n=1 Tax=Pseudohaliea sp. TaxID=2740289 RepID=UPI0032ECDACA